MADRMKEILKNMNCPICLYDLIEEGQVNYISIGPCNDLHAFHTDCIHQALKFDSRCPNCRLQLSPDFLEEIVI